MNLTRDEQLMLEGRQGAALKWAMDMLLAVGKACFADKLIPVSSCHLVIDPFAMGKSGSDLIVMLSESGARFAVPTTINAISYDRCGSFADDSLHDRYQRTMLQACENMGASPTCSCNPLAQGIVPSYGEALAWSESATAPFVNSVIGARTNREGATAFASALTGLTPRYGMHLERERRGEVLFEVDVPLRGLDEYNLLGSLIARRSNGRVPVLEGLSRPRLHELVGFSASAAIVSNLAIYHLVGITPEAPCVEAVFPDGVPPSQRVTRADLDAERARFGAGDGSSISLVSIGSPHASFDELQDIVRLLRGRRVREGISFLVTTNHSVLGLATAAGVHEALRNAGVTVTADRMCFGCDLGGAKFCDTTTVVTNSVKLATLAPGSRRVHVLVRSAAACVEAAVDPEWQDIKGGEDAANGFA